MEGEIFKNIKGSSRVHGAKIWPSKSGPNFRPGERDSPARDDTFRQARSRRGENPNLHICGKEEGSPNLGPLPAFACGAWRCCRGQMAKQARGIDTPKGYPTSVG